MEDNLEYQLNKNLIRSTHLAPNNYKKSDHLNIQINQTNP
jgi:hypothetical protein